MPASLNKKIMELLNVIEELEADLKKMGRKLLDANCETVEEDDPLKYLTLDTDKLGIWLIDDLPDGPQQLGYIPWKTIAQGVQAE